MDTAERIYSASTSERLAGARLAESLARRIEDDIVSSDMRAGGVMGSLRQLSERYSVGRAAAREAVALLERRRLGRLRPGPCGGFILARPNVAALGTEIADYFRMAGITRAQLEDARETVDLMAAWLAARARPGPAAVAKLPSSDESGSEIEWHLQMRVALGELSGEPVVALFVTSLNALTADFAGEPRAEREWRAAARQRSDAIRLALLAGNSDAVGAEAQSLNEDLGQCLRDDYGPLPLPAIAVSRQADDRTLATLVARRLGAEILRDGSAGQRLGSEWDLCERYSVSRATLRQAIRLLQDSGVVECRRGRGNGLMVRDLGGTGCIRLVLAYLIGHQMDPAAAGTIMFQLNRFVPALAVTRASVTQRDGLIQLVARVRSKDTIDRYDLLGLVQSVSELSDSPIIDLFSRCLAAYEARFHPSLREQLPAHMQTDYLEMLQRLLGAIAPGDRSRLPWAKRQSARIMLDMSRNRPI